MSDGGDRDLRGALPLEPYGDENEPPSPPERPPTPPLDEVPSLRHGIYDRGPFLRLIASFLHDIGFGDFASALELLSGARTASPVAQTLLSLTLSGRWDEIIAEIERIPCLARGSYRAAAFLVRRQQVLERLGSPDHSDRAERLLRDYIPPLAADDAAFFLVRDISSRARAVAPERRAQQRIGLFLYLLEALPAAIFVRGRLLEDELLGLITPFAVPTSPGRRQLTSLFNANMCDTYPVTWTCCKVDGAYNITLKHTLKEHEKPVTSLKWSFNDTRLLTCAKGEVAKLWDVNTGRCERTIRIPSNGGVGSCALHDYSETMFFSSCGPNSFIYRIDRHNNQLIPINIIPEVSDMVATHKGLLACVGSDNIIRLLSFTGDIRFQLNEEQVVTSLSLSNDHQLLIANVNFEKICVWNIRQQLKQRTCKACKQIVGSSLGGSDCFIASGSVGSQIYIWHWEHQLPFRILTGHEKAVNSVSWNQTRRYMLASGSADGSICIWIG
uniref:WD repeat-containing protein 26 n=1 Tax=Ananas comosus var. bracteatus TaxID=296719 RepID=A0A6V7PZH4_ANACO|nr:unnamed protein product [Ananas comosus var. bracteatus]